MLNDNLDDDFDEAHSDDDFYNSNTTIIALLMILVTCLQDADQERIRRRRPQRRYLCRPQLLPSPRYGTPWQRLRGSYNDRAYITTMGIDVQTFQYILDAGFEYLWNTTPIPRPEASRNGATRLGARSLDAAGALGLYLHWITSTMRATSLQEIFALVPTTVVRYLAFAEDILHATLKDMPDARVAWPDSFAQFEEYSLAIEVRAL